MKACLLLALAATPALMAAEPVKVTEANARTFYRDFVRLTAHARYVAPATSVLCRAPTAAMVAQDKKALGPHYQAQIHVYASPEAVAALRQNAAALPEGSVLIKEKLGAKDAVTEVGGMIKRAPGFDPAAGDWEYFFHDADGKFTTGQALANCADCHNAALKDHVYSAWKLAAKKP